MPIRTLLNPAALSTESEILWHFRVPRVLIAFLAGAGLGISGMAFQAMFRNPLATPFTLGVSSGAAFGAAVYVKLGVYFSFVGISGLTLSAFLGALLAILIVYALAKAGKGFSTATMLLAGVAIGEEIAISGGISLTYIKKLIFVASSLMVGGIVARCGPIGFVGMMSPHICRLIIGPNHRY
ncbi:MAG: FecCD family ABC transporter permease, partial [bacterium]